MLVNRSRRIAALAASLFLLTGCAPTSPASEEAAASEGGGADFASVDGPHAPQDRTPEATSTETRGTVDVTRFDLGNLDLPRTGGQPGEPFRTPVRGSLITPHDATGPKQLILAAHLRYPACAGADGELSFSYPCPDGATELRHDRGIEYLGEALAQRGFVVLIPELTPLYLNADEENYDQT